jgi:hypothetical protein
MDGVVEAQTEAWLMTLSEAGWMFQGWMELWRLRQRPGSFGGWLNVPKIDESMEAQTEAR